VRKILAGKMESQPKAGDARLRRLAASIEALAEKDALLLGHARDTADLRRSAALELHGICASFVESLNRLLTNTAIILDPPEYSEEAFSEDSPNLIQINASGRILQVSFACTDDLVSTEDFRIPYTLAGSIRAFNQRMLDKDLIEEQLLFFTLEKHRARWRFFDSRTYRSGPFDREYLISVMEQLI